MFQCQFSSEFADDRMNEVSQLQQRVQLKSALKTFRLCSSLPSSPGKIERTQPPDTKMRFSATKSCSTDVYFTFPGFQITQLKIASNPFAKGFRDCDPEDW